MERTFKDRVRGCCAGIFFGDILGLALENKTRTQIREEVGKRSVLDFLDPREFRNDKLPGYVGIGSYSDDWQLTAAVATSLLRNRGPKRKHGFDLDDLVKIHIEEYNETTFGWGKTTRESIANAKTRLSKPGGKAYVPVSYMVGQGAGNGVAMKIAPLALAHASQPAHHLQRLSDQVRALGYITHGDPRAHIAAFVLAVCLISACTYQEHGGKITIEDIENSLMFHLRAIEVAEGSPEPTLSGQLKLLMEPETLLSAESLSTKIGTSCVAWESVPYAIGVALRHRDDTTIEAAIKEAIEAGGDTDSNAAMVGALLGAYLGEDGIPKHWRIRLADTYKHVTNLADEFAAAFGKAST